MKTCSRCRKEHKEETNLCSPCKKYLLNTNKSHVKHKKNNNNQEDGSAYVALLEKQVKDSLNEV